MAIKLYNQQDGITEAEIKEIIDSYDELENWKPGETRTIVKFMRGNPHVSACVPLLEKDVQNTFFAFRGGREYPSRMLFLVNYVEEDARDIIDMATTSYMTAIIKKESEYDFLVKKAFYGLPTPKEPWSYKEKKGKDYEDSVTFWATHALLNVAQEKCKPLPKKDEKNLLERIPFEVYVSDNGQEEDKCIVKGISKAKEMMDIFFERMKELGKSNILCGGVYPHYNDKEINHHIFYSKIVNL